KGRAAGKLLLASADHVNPRVITLPTELRLGTTSAPPRTLEEHWFGP
ncbi:MAG TPA: LacI family transcriptional regulator, partial [Amycolatopsis sp.]|nr:LacI family transcriptional regulator [Amycolatopsis sp.]